MWINKERPEIKYHDYDDSLEIIWSEDGFYDKFYEKEGFSVFISYKEEEPVGVCIYNLSDVIENSKKLREQNKKDHEGLSMEELTNKVFQERTFGPKVFYTTYNDGSDMLYVSWHACTEDCDCETFESGANIVFRDRCSGVGYLECEDHIDAICLYGVSKRIIKRNPVEGLIKPSDPDYDNPNFRPVEEFLPEDEKELWKQRRKELEEQ